MLLETETPGGSVLLSSVRRIAVILGGALPEPAIPAEIARLHPEVVLVRVGAAVVSLPTVLALADEGEAPRSYQGLEVAGVRHCTSGYDGAIGAAAEADLVVMADRPLALRVVKATGRPLLVAPVFPPWKEDGHADA